MAENKDFYEFCGKINTALQFIQEDLAEMKTDIKEIKGKTEDNYQKNQTRISALEPRVGYLEGESKKALNFWGAVGLVVATIILNYLSSMFLK